MAEGSLHGSVPSVATDRILPATFCKASCTHSAALQQAADHQFRNISSTASSFEIAVSSEKMLRNTRVCSTQLQAHWGGKGSCKWDTSGQEQVAAKHF